MTTQNAIAGAPPQTVNVNSLRPGTRLQQHLFDETGVLLLAANTEITPRFLELLKGRGVRTVQLRQADPEKPAPRKTDTVKRSSPTIPRSTGRIKSTDTKKTTSDAPSPSVEDTPSVTTTESDPIIDSRADRHIKFVARAEEGLDAFQQATRTLNEVCDKLLRGLTISSDVVHQTVAPFTNMLFDDSDLLPFIMSMQKDNDEYLFEHSMNVALISMSIASQLDFSHKEITEIGMCGFLQDIGMLRVPSEIRLAPRALTEDEMYEIRCHPGHTVSILAGMTDAPESARLVSYQVHERYDGSGYPAQRSGMYLHPFSKIVAVADTYSAMVRPRPHRDAFTPYEAARKVLLEVKDERFESRIVRAFLDTVSIFPIGSKVVLNNGTVARVIRSNAVQHTKPIVEELSPDGKPIGNLIDLSTESVQIVDIV